MAPLITPRSTDFFFEHRYVSVSRDHVYLNAIESLRSSLIAKLVANHDVFWAKVEDTIIAPQDGRMYRAAYVDSIQVTGFTETKRHPTFGPRSQYNAIWMNIQYTEYSENIDDVGNSGLEMRGTSIAAQVLQLATAVAEHFKISASVTGTLHSGGSGSSGTYPHQHQRSAIWSEAETLAPGEGFHEELRREFKLCLENHCFDR